MLSNRKFYVENAGAEESWFSPRTEAVAYSKREAREAEFVKLVESGFREFDVDNRSGRTGSVYVNTLTSSNQQQENKRADDGDLIPEPVPPPIVKLEL